MKITRTRNILCGVLLLIGASAGLFAVLTIAKSKMKVEHIPPISQQTNLVTDVVTHDLDLLKVTSDWPKSLTVENISDKEVSGFTIMIWAANDDGGPGEFIGWGTNPNYAKQTTLFKPKETMTLPIEPETVKKFQDNGKPFLYVQLMEVWVSNDPKYKYMEGALLQQDPNNPKRYILIRDAKGRSKHNHAFPHITHSIKPPFPLGCCTREVYQSVEVDCDQASGCNPDFKCNIDNTSYTYCDSCCTSYQVTSQVTCWDPYCVPLGHKCTGTKLVTHSNPCNCCGC
jgi:hypothetical protein